jgi:sialate O-acetylesterase
MKIFYAKVKYLTVCGLLMNLASLAQIRLPKLISDGMVLQRGESVKIWGWASAHENVSVEFVGKKYLVKADAEGNWILKLSPHQEGGPYKMTFLGRNKVVLKDILYGDVWLCSGQSNMELDMKRLEDKYAEVISRSTNKEIRQFLVPDEYDFSSERTDFSGGQWESASPKNILKFTAVGYFFAKEVYAKYKVPIGIINSALGGSPAQAWLSERAIKQFPAYNAEFWKFKNQQLIDSIQRTETAKTNQWYAELNKSDLGLKKIWSKSEENTGDWQTIEMPADLKVTDLGNMSGVVWLKKEIDLSPNQVHREAKLLLGTLRDADSTFINGAFVGNTTYMYPPRRYLLSSNVLKEGKNIITVRLVVNSGNGGFVKGKPYQLIIARDTINLEGKWKYHLGAKMPLAPATTFIRWKPVGLYNAMIAPLKNFSLKGVLWYQGESNTGQPLEYGVLMRTLIEDWRSTFNERDLPFLYVQLPNYMAVKVQPGESGWASLRDQQRKLQDIPNTGMVVAIDLGEWNDVHPLNKLDIGKRLALQARKIAYKEKIVSAGPSFKDIKRKGNQLIISFSEIGEGLMVKGGLLRSFAIADSDGAFVWAEAAIVDNKVVLSNKEIAHPVKVRYAWADNPEGAKLYNSAGLPASPFEAEVK